MLEDIYAFLILFGAILAIITVIILFRNKIQKLQVEFVEHNELMQTRLDEDHELMQAKIDEEKKHTKDVQLQTNIYKGEINEILGSFVLLDEYDHLSIIGSVSKSASFDLIGLKENQLDFIEIKSVGAKLSSTENKVKKIIEEGNVFYRIVEGGIPSQFVTNDRVGKKKKD